MEIKRLTVTFAGASAMNESAKDVIKVTKDVLDHIFKTQGEFEPIGQADSVVLLYSDVMFPAGHKMSFDANRSTFKNSAADDGLMSTVKPDQIDRALTIIFENSKLNVVATEQANLITRNIIVTPKFG